MAQLLSLEDEAISVLIAVIEELDDQPNIADQLKKSLTEKGVCNVDQLLDDTVFEFRKALGIL